MPVLDAERRSATRFALRYRPIDPATSEQGPVVSRRRRSRPDILTTTSRVKPDELDQEEDRYPARQRSASVPAVSRKNTPPARVRRQFHPLFFIGLGLFATVLLWIGATQLIVWGTNEYNTMVYGYPRTFQIDQVVGHHDSPQNPSHFIAMNLKGQIVVIEMPGGEVSKSIVFRGPTTGIFESHAESRRFGRMPTVTEQLRQHSWRASMISWAGQGLTPPQCLRI